MQVESALLFETPDEIFQRVYRLLEPGTSAPQVDIAFRPFTSATSRVRRRGKALEVRITDLLSESPNQVIEALAWILLSRLLRRRVPSSALQFYRRYMNRQDIRDRIDEIRVNRGRKQQISPVGKHFDLERMFHQLNQRYFHGTLATPALGWSVGISRTRLGHYDPSHYSITVSRVLDGPKVPAIAVEYVLFHEMLHIVHPTQHEGARRCIHTPDFRRAEKAYPHFKESKKRLQELLS